MINFSSSKCWGMSVLVWLVTFVVSASADMVSIQITDTFDDMEEWTAGERIGRLRPLGRPLDCLREVSRFSRYE